MSNLNLIGVKPALFGSAQTYLYQDFNVIPILGDLDLSCPKQAGIDWKAYQHKRVNLRHLDLWFNRENFAGLAIVTGQISRLMVLDFDDEVLAEKFKLEFPHLLNTRTVLSAGRKLPHYYYRLPVACHVPSRHTRGLDLQAEGRYIIAPPTVIDGNAYTIERGGQAQPLKIEQISAILRFMDEISPSSHTVPNVSSKTIDTPSAKIIMTPDDAQNYYQQKLYLGRNESLFRTSLRLRDTGWLQTDVERWLIQTHVNQPALSHHKKESAGQRQREALKTIQSAFSRPPRKISAIDSDSKQTLPNSIREYLLQTKQTALVRVLDGLLMVGMTQGELLTERLIVEKLENHVGRYSILKALSAKYDDGSAIFSQIDTKTPSPQPPTHTDVASAIAGDTNNKCLLFRVTASDKTKMGRPAKTYQMPFIATLCAKFGLKMTKSDPITKGDLQSPKQYRQALEREFIKRKPGLYPRKWLAKRLGISKRTSQRDHAEMETKQRPMYFREIITWETLGHVPEDAEFGIFLQDELGKRYPANRQLAKSLLAKHHHLSLVRQDVNYYWHPDTPVSPSLAMGIHPKSAQNAPKKRFERSHDSVATKYTKIAEIGKSVPVKNETQSSTETSTEKESIVHLSTYKNNLQALAKKAEAKRFYRKELPQLEDELLAKRLYRKTMSQSGEEKYAMSLMAARQLVHQYGMELVKKLLQVFAWRDNIENYAGFAVVWLRSEAKRAEFEQMLKSSR
ncbi:MAG: hypothetical protein Phog2KO_11140 [Phototrophicaceae bacterium]